MGAELVAEDLYRVDAPLGERFASLYLLVGADGVLLFDTGIDGMIPGHVLPAISDLGIGPEQVIAVVVSHCDVDHFGGVSDAREQFPNARILAHARDRAAIENFHIFLNERARGFVINYGLDEEPAVLDWSRSVVRETKLDGTVDEGDRIDLGNREAVVWHVPGHSRGQLAIEAPWANAIMVSDAVLGTSVNLADGTPSFPPTYRYVDDYLATIERLEHAGHELLLTAHYPVFRGREAADFLAESRAFVQRLEALVSGVLADHGALTLAELLAIVNPQAGAWPKDGTAKALAFPVVGHLERMLAAGTIEPAGDRNGAPAWRAA